jgi:hypothetical protein
LGSREQFRKQDILSKMGQGEIVTTQRERLEEMTYIEFMNASPKINNCFFSYI